VFGHLLGYPVVLWPHSRSSAEAEEEQTFLNVTVHAGRVASRLGGEAEGVAITRFSIPISPDSGPIRAALEAGDTKTALGLNDRREGSASSSAVLVPPWLTTSTAVVTMERLIV
jgi:hypothetical protein